MRRIAIATLGLLAAGGCTPPGVLVAPTGHHRMTANDRGTGIAIIVTTGVWEGEPATLEGEATVVHAVISNLGKTPIRIAPGDLELRDERGFRYDLYDVGATFVRLDPGEAPADGYARSVERSYHPGRTVDFDPILPVGDIGEMAMPWGMLEPGTQMRGFLYFEPLAKTGNAATLVWHVDGADDRPVADFTFDFVVSRGV